MPLCEFYARQRPVQLRCLCSFAQSTSTSRRRSQPPVTGCVCLCRAAADLRPLFYVCVCVCALVFVRGSGCCCVSVCVSCLEFLLLLLLLFPTVTLRGQRKYLGWLACISRSSLDEFTRLWLAWLATHTESKQTESASAFASDSDFEPISATDFEYNSEILIPHPSSAPSAFNLSRAVSLSRLPQCVCPCVCIHLYISVLAN